MQLGLEPLTSGVKGEGISIVLSMQNLQSGCVLYKNIDANLIHVPFLLISCPFASLLSD